MDYKRAWMLLDSINQAFTEPVTDAASGGPKGGGAVLTPFGAEISTAIGVCKNRPTHQPSMM
jgi:molybdate transport system regulatory protein